MLVRKEILNKLGFKSISKLANFFLLINLIEINFLAESFQIGEKFQVYWNVPSQACVNRSDVKPPLNPKKFDIITNDDQKFHGNKLVVFYEDQLGLYPKLNYKEDSSGKFVITERINGGLPQNVSVTEHLKKAKVDIEKLIPDPLYSGLAVIDYEHWRPIYTQNWMGRNVYRTESTLEAMRKNPKLNIREAHKIGQKAFTKAAREIMLETLRLGRKIRPKALWGFYEFPICNNDVGEKTENKCTKAFYNYNKEMYWLYNEVDALYPSIYLYKESPRIEEARYVYAKTKLADDTRMALKKPNLKIILFSKIEYEPYEEPFWYYSKSSLCDTITYPGDLGYDGIIIWSTSKNIKGRCSKISEYLNTMFGPYKQLYSKRTNRCRQKLCTNHGRCVIKKEFSSIDKYKCEINVSTEKFRCQCDTGFNGKNCENANI